MSSLALSDGGHGVSEPRAFNIAHLGAAQETDKIVRLACFRSGPMPSGQSGNGLQLSGMRFEARATLPAREPPFTATILTYASIAASDGRGGMPDCEISGTRSVKRVRADPAPNSPRAGRGILASILSRASDVPVDA